MLVVVDVVEKVQGSRLVVVVVVVIVVVVDGEGVRSYVGSS